MEIFTEAKSTFYKALEEIINTAHEEGIISRNEIYQILTKYGCNFPVLENRVFGKNKSYQKNVFVLKQQDEQSYKLRIDAKIPPYVTNLEILWLQFILSSRYVNLFLDEVTIKKIMGLKTADAVKIEPDIIIPKNYSKILKREDIKHLAPKVRFIIKSMLDKKIIKYTYTTRQGEIYKNQIGIPVKLQYSLKDDMFYAIFYSVENKNFAKCIVQNLCDLREEQGSFNREEVLKEYKEYLKRTKKQQPITLEVVNTRNAIERAFCIFSPFEKSARFLKDKNKHEIKIYYYEFKEAEIISRILYLGKDVVVVEPQSIRNEIISRVKRALMMYGQDVIV